MGLSRSLNTGTSALRVNQQNLDVISNNIANVNTIGYKSSRATFADQFSQTLDYGRAPDQVNGNGLGGVSPMQMGLGVKMAAISNDMSQGTLETTDRALDLALAGSGFFVYDLNGMQLYSRAGDVSLDRDGYLVDSATGAFLQGYNPEYDEDGKIIRDSDGNNILNRTITDLRIPPNVLSPPQQTENIAITGNLNSSTAVDEERQTSITIFDNKGGSHSLNLTFTKSSNLNEWGVSATIDGVDIALDEDTINFNIDGSLESPAGLNVTASDLNAALETTVFDEDTPKDIAIQLLDENDPISGSLTQFSGATNATASSQDGFQAGDLQDVSVDENGKIYGAFSNGQTELLGQVVIAKFTNQQGLLKEGGNFFSVSPNSGLANIGTAGETFESTAVASGALETSNVDMTEEFTDMIKTQRAYEAASRTITVSDALLQETNNLKR